MQHWASVIVGKADVDALPARSESPSKTQPPARVASRQSATDLPQRRAAALRGLFPKLASWFEDSTGRTRRNEIEAYLSHATDIADLEERMRRLQQRAIYSHFC